jgi:hypothetical protein
MSFLQMADTAHQIDRINGSLVKCRVTRESSARSARPSNCHTLDLPPVRTVERIDQNKLGVFSSPPSPFARRMMTSL